MNSFLKVALIVILSLFALGMVVIAQAGTGKNYVPYLGIAIFIVVTLLFRKKDKQ